MRTTDAPVTDTPEAKAQREAAERARLNAEAERVMNESKPTPTQAEVDAIKRGEMDHDDKEDPENPSMPPLHEQHARIAEAGRSAPYRRRATEAADDGAPYRTRDARAERQVDREPAKPESAKP